jgi:membrane-bound ClpP family serine protease
MHLSRPMYEGLPWLYIGAGLAALGVSYLLGDTHAAGLVAGLAGLGALVGGVVVLLRRRDYRDLRSQYRQPDLLQRRDQD